MYRVTAVQDERYPCAPPDGGDSVLERLLDELPPAGANDGVVPLRSQLWGEPLWIGRGDHLDMVGHFPGPDDHTDWLTSGARFDIERFDTILDRVVDNIVDAD
jgi:hypothetical protein